MNTYTVKKIFLYLLLVLVGLYAGMLFFHEMSPVETQMSPAEYARYWKITDGDFMHHRMGIFGPILLGLFLLTIIIHLKNRKTLFFLMLMISFLLFVTDVVLINTSQMPINEYIRSLDPQNLTDADLAEIRIVQAKSIANFQFRFVLSMVSFLFLSLTPFLHQSVNPNADRNTHLHNGRPPVF